MKLKNKILMPILGVAATAGTVIPAAVSCESKQAGIDYKIESATAGHTIEVVSVNAPKVVVGKDYTATFEWKEFDEETKEVGNSYATQAIVTDHFGEPIGDAQLVGQNYRSVSVFVPAEKVQEKMSIALTVQPGKANKLFNLEKGEAVTGYDGTKHSGITADIGESELDANDNILEYTFNLKSLEASANKDSKTIIGATKIAFWMDRKTVDFWGNKRVTPTSTGYVYLGQKRVNSTWNNTSRALTITIDHAITEEDLQQNYQIFSYFDFSGAFAINLNGGKCCAYCTDALPKPE